jgi:hypothetical protein
LKRFVQFLRLSSGDKNLLIRIALWLCAIRLGLWFLPFRNLCRLLNRWVLANNRQTADESSVKKVVWGVRKVSRYVPAASCLTQALVTWVFLRARGQCADLRIGVAKDAQGQLEAHAWVKIGSTIVVGKQSNHARYSELPPLKKLVS